MLKNIKIRFFKWFALLILFCTIIIHQLSYDRNDHFPIIVHVKGQNNNDSFWNKTYGGGAGDYANALVQTSDDGFVLAGYISLPETGDSSMWLVNTDKVGNMIWNRTYGSGNINEINDLVQTIDGGFAIVGKAYKFGVGLSQSILLIKTDEIGNMIWNKTYSTNRFDGINAFIQTKDNGYALTGYINEKKTDVLLIKTDNDGNLLWKGIYGGQGDDKSSDIVQTFDGGYALAGSITKVSANGGSHRDMLLIKTDEEGNMLWNTSFGGKGWDHAYALVQTSDHGFALAGYTKSFDLTNADMWLVKTDAVGNLLWEKRYGRLEDDFAYDIIQTNGGGFALVGAMNILDNTNSIQRDMIMIKTDFRGNKMWSKSFGGKDWEEGNALVGTNDENFALAGYTKSFGAGDADMWLVKTTFLGNSYNIKKIVQYIKDNRLTIFPSIFVLITAYLFYRRRKNDRNNKDFKTKLYPDN